MTPNKRATLLTAFVAVLGAGLVLWHLLTGGEWAQLLAAIWPRS
jgi:hypothetical protein